MRMPSSTSPGQFAPSVRPTLSKCDAWRGDSRTQLSRLRGVGRTAWRRDGSCPLAVGDATPVDSRTWIACAAAKSSSTTRYCDIIGTPRVQLENVARSCGNCAEPFQVCAHLRRHSPRLTRQHFTAISTKFGGAFNCHRHAVCARRRPLVRTTESRSPVFSGFC